MNNQAGRMLAAEGEDTPEISVVSPVYGCAGALPELCRRLSDTLRSGCVSYEIILVDDRSPDASWEVIEELVRAHPRLIAIRLSRNFGQHYAITAGLDVARGKWVAVMDCDLQDAPEDIPRLLEKAREGYDVVLARRIARKDKALKRLSSRLFYKVLKSLSGMKMDTTVGTFRILSRPVVEALGTMRETHRLFGGMVEWLGFRTGYVDVLHNPRSGGKSSYDLHKLLRLAFDGIVSFSNRPLYFSVVLGAFISFSSIAYGISLVVRRLVVGAFGVPGWLTAIALTAFVGGMILINLGIIGIYLGRLYDQTKCRPLYVIDRVIRGSS